MIVAHCIALAPNDYQANYFARAAGTARKAWNWALAEWKRQYEIGAKPNEMALRKQLNAIKQQLFPWMLEVTKNAPQQAIKNLGTAFKNFFAGRAKYPKFKKKGSSNRGKARMRLARLHARIKNIRVDVLHKLTTYLTRNFSLIGIEDLNVKGMIKNRVLARSIADMGFYEFRRQLQYKALRTGSRVVTVSRFFPSSKTCSVCGCVKKDLLLADRSWWCPECGAQHDRALNAAINRKNMAVSSTVSAYPANAGLRCDACGEEGAGLVVKNHKVKPASVKQELSAKSTCG